MPPLETLQQQSQKERDKRAFELYAEAFFRRWAPQGARDNLEFHTQFFMLIRQIYLDAQEPSSRRLLAILDRLPASQTTPAILATGETACQK
jgi:hypothetical protein